MKERSFKSRGAGSGYCLDVLRDDKGTRVARSLLHRVMIEFAKRSRSYFSKTGDHVYSYGERQLHSGLFPAFFNSADLAFFEPQILRKPRGGESGMGRMDYLVRDRGTIMLFEVKHGYHQVVSGRLNGSAIGRWKKAISQLNSVRRKEVRRQVVKERDKLLKIALYIIPSWIFRKTYDRIEEHIKRGQDTIEEDHVRIRESLKPKPNWSAYWIPPSDMRMLEHRGGYGLHHAVHAFGFVNPVPRKRSKRHS